MSPKYYIKTYGCQMNDLDSLQVGRLFKKKGWEATLDLNEADAILVNTCSIREKASQKVYSDVGRFRSLKLQRPEVVLGVLGCQAQAEGGDLLKRFPYLDLVAGPDHLVKVPDWVEKASQGKGFRQAEVKFEKRGDYQFLNLLPEEEENQVKAFVTIMKGCDNFCSFCVVPYVRGPEVCRRPEEIVQEVKKLVKLGVKEVTLLGQNVNSYGLGRHQKLSSPFSEKGEMVSFAELLNRISQETAIERIRFTTSHPKDLPQELIKEFGANSKLARSFHLPVQSGSDRILEKMYRGYTRKSYLDRLNSFRDIDPNIAFSTDIIVGFPGETQKDFEATMDLLREVRYDSIYSFVYSPRPKTTAALYFKDDVAQEVKQERLKQVQSLQDQISYEKNRSWVGKRLDVLVEGPSKQGDTYCGRSSQNHQVHFKGSQTLIGRVLAVKIHHAGPNSLLGEVYG